MTSSDDTVRPDGNAYVSPGPVPPPPAAPSPYAPRPAAHAASAPSVPTSAAYSASAPAVPAAYSAAVPAHYAPAPPAPAPPVHDAPVAQAFAPPDAPAPAATAPAAQAPAPPAFAPPATAAPAFAPPYVPDGVARVLTPEHVTGPDLVPGPRSRGRGLGAGALVTVILVGLVSGVVGAAGTTWVLDARAAEHRAGPTVVEVPGTPAGATTDRAPASVAGVAAAVLPSVVSIEVRGVQGVSTGSGFVYSADGFVLTNNHVVADAAGGSAITVTFSDGSESDGTVVGRTEGYDLAVVKVERSGLVPLTLGDSRGVVVGAIGAPLGLEGTVTTGIVSALNRPVTAGDQVSTSWINALQTDAAINPGNSGGPLVNLRGEVVGVNSAIAQAPGATGSGVGSIGLGFAIPANQVRRTAEQLIETGRATRPIIGALLDSRYDGEGVRVVRAEDAPPGEHPVTPGGPADQAGVRAGDVIVAIDGRPVTQEDELLVAIRALAPGDEVVLTLREPGGDRDVTVVLDEADAD